jgi:hypothetical protein
MSPPRGVSEYHIRAKAVEARLFSNPIEFDGIEIGIIQLFPNAEEFDGVAVAQPVLNQVGLADSCSSDLKSSQDHIHQAR